MNRQKIVLIFSSCMLLLGLPHNVNADEIVITSNGSESENAVVVSQNTQNAIQQSNTTTTNNQLTTNANTGGNTASSNTTGDVGIETGNVVTDTSIANTANASSIVSSPCCSQDGTDVIVANNGAGSTNAADVSSSNQHIVIVTQHATISNIISGQAVTGNNTASNNNGNVSIKTGNILVNETIKNGPINVSSIAIPQGSGKNSSIKVAGNGAESHNTVHLVDANTNLLTIINLADIINISDWHLQTGGNTASFNNGDVSIKTGDITHTTKIENGPINTSGVTVSCCHEEKNPSPAPTPQTNAPTPSNPSPSTGGGTSGNGNPQIGIGGPGEVLAATIGKILPATGTNWLFYATLANIVMLFIGVILRLRSGRSPGFVYVR